MMDADKQRKERVLDYERLVQQVLLKANSQQQTHIAEMVKIVQKQEADLVERDQGFVRQQTTISVRNSIISKLRKDLTEKGSIIEIQKDRISDRDKIIACLGHFSSCPIECNPLPFIKFLAWWELLSYIWES